MCQCDFSLCGFNSVLRDRNAPISMCIGHTALVKSMGGVIYSVNI